MTSELRLLETITLIKQDYKSLNYSELISVLKSLKTISEQQHILHSIIQSLETLKTNALKNEGHLTKRELQVLKLIGQGIQSSGIAHEFNLSVSTVETHRKNIRKKLKLDGKEKLIVFAIIFNILEDNY